MRRHCPHVAAPDEVKITHREVVTIEDADARIARTHISMTGELRRMSDYELLE